MVEIRGKQARKTICRGALSLHASMGRRCASDLSSTLISSGRFARLLDIAVELLDRGIVGSASSRRNRRGADFNRHCAVVMSLVRIEQSSPSFPPGLTRYLGEMAPGQVMALGNLDVLRTCKTALFCSIKCPGNLILKTYDLACELRDKGVTVIGGFHSPMERECLTLLLRGTQPVIVCPARSIEGMRIPGEWRKPLSDGRLLVLSPFDEKHRRPTAALAADRNDFVAAMADAVFIAHAAPGSKTESFCRRILSWGKPVLTFDSPENANLLSLGAKASSKPCGELCSTSEPGSHDWVASSMLPSGA